KPALIVVGPAVVARKLKLAARTARAWTAGSRRPAEPRKLARAIVAVAGEAGLTLHSDENLRAEKICAELPWRVVAVQFSASLAVAMFAEQLGGVRALARAVGEAEPTVRRWGALGSGELRPIGHLNGIVAKLAKFARAEI